MSDDPRIERIRAVVASWNEQARDAQAAAIGLRPAVERREVVEAVRLMRADAEHMTREQRRELLRASVGRIAVSADEIDLDLLIDTGHVAPGEHACRSDLARHRIPAGRLTIATPRNRTRRKSA